MDGMASSGKPRTLANRFAASVQFSPATTCAAVLPPSTCTTTEAPGGRALTASQALWASTALLSRRMEDAWLFAVALIACQQAPRRPFPLMRHSDDGGCTIVILPLLMGRGGTTRPVTRRASPAVRSPRTHFSSCGASRAASVNVRSRRSSIVLFHRRPGQPYLPAKPSCAINFAT